MEFQDAIWAGADYGGQSFDSVAEVRELTRGEMRTTMLPASASGANPVRQVPLAESVRQLRLGYRPEVIVGMEFTR